MTIDEIKVYTFDKSILYVEDDDDIREQTADFLLKFFKTVVSSVNGKDGLEKFEENDFDMIITDINMPIMNGIEMIKAIKETNENIPIIITSAHNESDYLMPLINLGVDKFLLKPFDRKKFLSVLYKVSRAIQFEKDEIILTNKIKENEHKLKTILEIVDSGIVIVENTKVISANKSALNMLKVKSLLALENAFYNLKDKLIRLDKYIYAETLIELIQKTSTQDDFFRIMLHTDIGKCTYLINTKQLDDITYVISFTDITAIDNQEKYNQFTKLPNKVFLSEKIDEKLRYKNAFNILLFSINNYQSIIKWHGRSAGYDVEKKIANYLQNKFIDEKFGESVFLSNINKNQFAILAEKDFSDKLKEIVKELSKLSSIKENSESEMKKEINIAPKIKVLEIDLKLSINEVLEEISKEADLLAM